MLCGFEYWYKTAELMTNTMVKNRILRDVTGHGLARGFLARGFMSHVPTACAVEVGSRQVCATGGMRDLLHGNRGQTGTQREIGGWEAFQEPTIKIPTVKCNRLEAGE